ncbi:MAG: hypothetical protein WAT29_09485 [Thiolinea sp.]
MIDIIIIAIVLAPTIGVYYLLTPEMNAYYFATNELFHKALINSSLFLITYYIIRGRSFLRSEDILGKITLYIPDKKEKLFHILSIMSLPMALFAFNGISVITGEINRGDLRVSFGLFGWFYTFFKVFFIPYLLIVSLFIIKTKNYNKIFLVLSILSLLLSVFSFGSKSAIIYAILPSLLFLKIKPSESMKYFLILTLIVLITSVASSIYIDGVQSVEEALHYTLYRATVGAAYGIAAVNQAVPDGVGVDFLYTFIFFFGAKAASFMLGIDENSIEFQEYDMTRHVTYLTYGDGESALSGTVNVMPTFFGEALYISNDFYFLYTLFFAIAIAKIVNVLLNKIKKGKINISIMLAIYITGPVIWFLLSGGILTLFSFPIMIYMILTYLTIKSTNFFAFKKIP